MHTLPEELQPCEHMTTLVSRRSDDTLMGPAKWYTDFHVLTCPHCRAALKGLRELQSEVAVQIATTPHDRPKLPEERWQVVERNWDQQSS